MRLKLFLAFAAVVLVSILSFVWLMRQETARQVRMYMFRGNVEGETSLTTSLEIYYQRNGSWDGISSFFGNSMRGQGQMGGMRPGSGPPGLQLTLADSQGNIVYDSADERTGENLSLLQRWQAVTLAIQGETIGYLITDSMPGTGAGSETILVERLSRAALTTAVIGGTLALVLGLFLAYRLIRPIRDLTAAAQRLSAGDLTSRVEPRGNDEIAVLAEAFNDMADSLQKAEANRQTMTADIAHELRTPLSVQRAHLEALEDGIYPLVPENLQPIYEQNRVLNRLVEDLRMLAMADAGQLKLDLEPIDLSRLVGKVVEAFQPRAQAQQVQLIFIRPDSSIFLPLDAGRIEQILSNLLSNALRYSPAGGKIYVDFQKQDPQVQISIRDQGSGIPEHELEHIFERFYRADRSRTREDGGSGLGLAIARQLAEAHHGSLRAGNHPQGGAVFTLILPIHPEERK